MKKYKLKKDTPNLKAGSIFERNASSYHCKEHDFYYKTEYVENNPEWFEPIPERIELVFCENKVGTKKVYLGKKSFDVFKFTRQEKNLMEKALNGELFTKEHMKDYANYADGMQYSDGHREDQFKEYLNQKK